MFVLVDLFGVFINQNTFDGGDSILHFIYAQQALDYPSYLLHHWAKPIFVLFASPFAQMGWIGMKLFNTICIVGALLLMSKLYQWANDGQRTPSRNLIWILPFGLLMPDLFMVQSSGLTEPLFALLLCAGLMAYHRGYSSWALIIWSFLPFVRSEGWIVIPVLAVLCILNGKVKKLGYFTFGTIAYSIIGSSHHHDLLWVFHRNPYSGTEHKYGSGSWFHYVEQLPYAMGLPLFLLLVAGTVLIGFHLIQNKVSIRSPFVWAITIFWAFFCAHTIFWAMGWFHSFGLRRVFIAVLPLTTLISAYVIDRLQGGQFQSWGRVVIILTVLIFPFTGNKMGFSFPDSLKKDVSLRCADEAAKWFQSSQYSSSAVCYAQHYLTIALERDMDDPAQVRIMEKGVIEDLEPGTVIFWDSYFSYSDKGVSEQMLESAPDIFKLQEFSVRSSDKTHRISMYRKSG